jgi:hypothetical protein
VYKIELNNLVIVQDVSSWICVLIGFLIKEILKELLIICTGCIDRLQYVSVFVSEIVFGRWRSCQVQTFYWLPLSIVNTKWQDVRFVRGLELEFRVEIGD